MDFEIQRCTRLCAVTGREFAPEETFYSVLVGDGADVKRMDYSPEAWTGPPEDALGWWKSRMPGANKRKKWAPNDVMLDFFDRLENEPQRSDMRYVLALLLVRRRVFREEGAEADEQGRPILTVYCPRRDATYSLPVVTPEESRIEAIQDELAHLLE